MEWKHLIRFVFGDKMGKSVVIIGKGPSVKKSTKEVVDSFDDVAIIDKRDSNVTMNFIYLLFLVLIYKMDD